MFRIRLMRLTLAITPALALGGCLLNQPGNPNFVFSGTGFLPQIGPAGFPSTNGFPNLTTFFGTGVSPAVLGTTVVNPGATGTGVSPFAGFISPGFSANGGFANGTFGTAAFGTTAGTFGTSGFTGLFNTTGTTGVTGFSPGGDVSGGPLTGGSGGP